MRILVTIPHFFHASKPTPGGRHGSQTASAESRTEALSAAILALHQHFGQEQAAIQLVDRRTVPANAASRSVVHVVVCTTGAHHLLERVPVERSLFFHSPCDAEPLMLGFECHSVLRNRWGNYDFYCYLEDDLILHDPWFFEKLTWFNRCVGQDKLLQPNRFERGKGPHNHKVYVDGDLAPGVTAHFQRINEENPLGGRVLGIPVIFRRQLNPHAGSFFLNAEQMRHWTNQSYFDDRDTSFIGPLESAATLGVMKTFKVYKSSVEYASFLEIEHFGNGFLRLIK